MSTPLLDYADNQCKFDGATFEPEHDLDRLTTQFERVKAVMLKGGWYTLRELQRLCGGSEAGISARLRDMRKTKWGGFQVERRRRGDPALGIWEYSIKR